MGMDQGAKQPHTEGWREDRDSAAGFDMAMGCLFSRLLACNRLVTAAPR